MRCACSAKPKRRSSLLAATSQWSWPNAAVYMRKATSKPHLPWHHGHAHGRRRVHVRRVHVRRVHRVLGRQSRRAHRQSHPSHQKTPRQGVLLQFRELPYLLRCPVLGQRGEVESDWARCRRHGRAEQFALVICERLPGCLQIEMWSIGYQISSRNCLRSCALRRWHERRMNLAENYNATDLDATRLRAGSFHSTLLTAVIKHEPRPWRTNHCCQQCQRCRIPRP